MMSNARGLNSRRGQGSRPGFNERPLVENSSAAQPQAPMGAQPPFPRKEKDDLRSKIMKAKARYEDLCDSVDGHRFRVRAEILDNREDYITVEIGCELQGVISLPWAEYSTATLEIAYGSRLDLARKVKMMIRRSPERLGYDLDVVSALAMRGTDGEAHLLMSNKDWKSLNETSPIKVGRLPVRQVAPVPVSAPVAPLRAPTSSGSGFNAQSAADARRIMEERFEQLFPGDSQSDDWSSPQGQQAPVYGPPAVPPPSQQRGTGVHTPTAHGRGPSQTGMGDKTRNSDHGQVPAPTGPGQVLNVPLPTTRSGG
jgi:hypothetical protein